MLAHGEFHQLEVQIVHVLNQVQRVFQMSFLLLALLPEQVRKVHVPEQEYVFLLLADVLAGGDERRKDRFGTELQRPEQVFQLPQIENVFGDVLPPFRFGDVHYLIQVLGPVRCLRKYCCDFKRLRDCSTMFFVSVRIVR